jgi:hypothetical protein
MNSVPGHPAGHALFKGQWQPPTFFFMAVVFSKNWIQCADGDEYDPSCPTSSFHPVFP